MSEPINYKETISQAIAIKEHYSKLGCYGMSNFVQKRIDDFKMLYQLRGDSAVTLEMARTFDDEHNRICKNNKEGK